MDHKILLIDDSAILRRIAVNVLATRGGYGEVFTATRATEGFARACTYGVTLILADYQIAGFPGAELCQRLLDEPRTGQVPVVLLLGPGMAPPRDSMPANIVDYLVKPFTPEQLLATVRGVSSGASARWKTEVVKALDSIHPKPVLDHHPININTNATAIPQSGAARLTDTHWAIQPTVTPTVPPVPGRLASHRPIGPARLHQALVAAAERQEAGVLRISAGDEVAADIYLEGGRIVVVATRDVQRYHEDAGGMRPPKVSPTILENALAEQSLDGTPFFLALGSAGVISKSAAITLLHQAGQRYFARFWNECPRSYTIDYETLDALPGFALRLEPRQESVEEWLLESSRHIKSTAAATLVRHERPDGVPRLHAGYAAETGLPRLNDQERDFVCQVDGRRNLATIATSLEVSIEDAFLMLYRLRCVGIMEYRPARSAFVVTPRTSVRRVLPLQH